ncbi:MAG: hypothetical protein H0T46_04705 [Deltaproteobacteria bacterium]|nr:hypothetical protein [Deltaproteobacteria bacterium]
MWPFSGEGPALWLALYLLTFALHAVFVSYVLAGTAYAFVQSLRRADDAIAERVRDRLPFMLGCGITAGVAPLLFLQLLYQKRFYTANLLMGPRWGAVVPALIIGFYALYLAKAKVSLRVRRLALATGTLCFLFVAWSWTEIDQLMQADAVWRDMYAAGKRIYGASAIYPRLLLWLGAMLSLFAIVASWWASGPERRKLAVLGLIGRAVSVGAALLLVAAGGATDGNAHGWLYLLVAALAVEAAGWVWMIRAPDGPGLTLVTGAGAAALVCATVVREAPRLALIEPARPEALEAAGFPVFAATFVLGVAVIAWIWRAISDAKT